MKRLYLAVKLYVGVQAYWGLDCSGYWRLSWDSASAFYEALNGLRLPKAVKDTDWWRKKTA